MGTLVYGETEYEFDDRLLAHLEMAITMKQRRRETFLLNWPTSNGRISLWISPGIPLEYRFGGSKPPALNRAWIDALERSSQGIRGMLVMPEATATEYSATAGEATAP